MRVFLELSFDGREFHGWQRQPNGVTVQETLEEKLSLFTGEPMSIMGCGRTDAGVHANYFVAHSDWPDASPNSKRFKDWEEAAWKLNGMLPPSIAIHRISEVEDKAHARFDAIERGYVYKMHLHKDPFAHGRSTRLMRTMNFDRMKEAIPYLIRHGDFASFCKSGSDQQTTTCDVRFAELRLGADANEWEFEIRADRFLRNMVRAIVGTLFEIGQGRLAPSDMADIIERKERSSAGASAPPDGLYLHHVKYPSFQSFKLVNPIQI